MLLFGFLMSITAGAAATVEINRIECECETCHGVTGKGDGE
jgi:hypothetical protein